MNCLTCCGLIVLHPKVQLGRLLFLMTYRAEAVIPLESGFSTLKTYQFNIEENDHLLSDSLDVAEERREVATVKMVHY